MTAEEKQGIGGRDCIVMNLKGSDGHEGHWIDPLIIASCPSGVRFELNDRSFVIPVDDFNELIGWLKSWEYI